GKAITLSSGATGSSHTISAGHSLLFNPSASNVSNDEITFAAHGLSDGQAVVYNNGGGTSIAPLTNNTTYYVIRVDDDTIKLADTLGHALAGTAIHLTSVGSGSGHSLTHLDSLSFAPSASNVSGDEIIFQGQHNLVDGEEVIYNNGGGSNVSIAPLSNN